MTEHIKTPELRFSNFLDMWHIHKLSDVATITGGGTPSTKVSEYWNGEIDWYTPNEIGERIYAKGSKKKITNLGYKKSSTKLLPVNTILFTSRAGIGNTAILAKEGCTNQGFQSIIPNSEKIDSYFIYTISNHIKKYALKHAAGSTFLEISGKELGKMKLFLPSLKEQQKIGVFFSKLDRQIELEEKKLELLEQQKKGYMQKIFAQELRFKDENGNDYPDWVTKKLGDIGKVAMNKRIYKNETTENGEIPFYKIGNFGKNADTFITREKFDEYKEKYPYPNVGDILISASGSIGRTIEYTGEDAYYQDSNIVWLNHNDEVINKYLKYFYKIVKWSGIEGTTIKRLYNKNILNTKIELPTVEEQYKMANFLSKLDKIIDIQIEKIELLKQRKQGLLQKMFV